MRKCLQFGLAMILVSVSSMALAESITYRLDGRYPGIPSEWIEVDYSDVKPGHINKISYWNTSDEKDALDIVEQKYVEYDGGGAFTGKVNFPMSGDQYQYAINSEGFVLGDDDPVVFEEE